MPSRRITRHKATSRDLLGSGSQRRSSRGARSFAFPHVYGRSITDADYRMDGARRMTIRLVSQASDSWDRDLGGNTAVPGRNTLTFDMCLGYMSKLEVCRCPSNQTCPKERSTS